MTTFVLTITEQGAAPETAGPWLRQQLEALHLSAGYAGYALLVVAARGDISVEFDTPGGVVVAGDVGEPVPAAASDSGPAVTPDPKPEPNHHEEEQTP